MVCIFALVWRLILGGKAPPRHTQAQAKTCMVLRFLLRLSEAVLYTRRRRNFQLFFVCCVIRPEYQQHSSLCSVHTVWSQEDEQAVQCTVLKKNIHACPFWCHKTRVYIILLHYFFREIAWARAASVFRGWMAFKHVLLQFADEVVVVHFLSRRRRKKNSWNQNNEF